MLTLNELRQRVTVALELDQIDEPELFEITTSALFTDLVQALAYDRCESPQQACRIVGLLLLLEADDRYPT